MGDAAELRGELRGDGASLVAYRSGDFAYRSSDGATYGRVGMIVSARKW